MQPIDAERGVARRQTGRGRGRAARASGPSGCRGCSRWWPDLAPAGSRRRCRPGTVVVRAVPNTPALVGAGVAAMSGGSTPRRRPRLGRGHPGGGGHGRAPARAPSRRRDRPVRLRSGLRVPGGRSDDRGRGAGRPAPRREPRTWWSGTLSGSARLLAETGEDPAVLRAAVTSPGGTTAAGLRTLEFRAVRSAFIEAVASATERSRQLGR